MDGNVFSIKTFFSTRRNEVSKCNWISKTYIGCTLSHVVCLMYRRGPEVLNLICFECHSESLSEPPLPLPRVSQHNVLLSTASSPRSVTTATRRLTCLLSCSALFCRLDSWAANTTARSFERQSLQKTVVHCIEHYRVPTLENERQEWDEI